MSYGALAALCAAGVGLNAWAEAHGFPTLTHWFGDQTGKDIGRTIFALCTLGAGFFGYLSGTQRGS